MDKFSRNYNLFIDTASGETIRIAPPLTLELDITRKLLGSANVASFRIFNLSKENRNDLRFNMYNYGQFRSIKLYAGYGNNLTLCFAGNIHEAWSVREGNNFITQIESFDAGFAFINSPFALSAPAGTNQVDIVKQAIGAMTQVDPNVSVGSITNKLSSQITRGNAISGTSAPDVIQQEYGNGFFVDNGKANFLLNNECLQGEVQTISSESGLLGTPLLEQSILSFDMIFEPRILVGQLVNLESSTDNTFNGAYKVTGLHHKGTISEAVCGDLTTSISCLTGIGQLALVSAA